MESVFWTNKRIIVLIAVHWWWFGLIIVKTFCTGIVISALPTCSIPIAGLANLHAWSILFLIGPPLWPLVYYMYLWNEYRKLHGKKSLNPAKVLIVLFIGTLVIDIFIASTVQHVMR